MQFDKFTLKSQEAVQAAQQIAVQRGHQEIKPAHLAKAILEQPDGVVVPVLQKMGIDPSRVLTAVNMIIDESPQVSGGGAVWFLPGHLSTGAIDPARHRQYSQRP